MKRLLNIEKFKGLLAIFCLLLCTLGTVRAEKGWQLVTSTSSLSAGDSVIIVAADYDFALSTTQQSNNRQATAITKSGNIAVITGDVQILTLEAGVSAGTFAFNTGSGYLYAAGNATSGNYLRTKATLDARGSFLITIGANGETTVVAQTTETDRTHMRFNESNNPKIFSCYASGSSVSNLVAIYKYVELGALTVATPTFSVPSGLYTTPQTVAISCATAGATILYTTDNSNPAVNGQVYSSPLTISSTTTVKAIAVAGSDTSFQASATYTFPATVANLAAFKALTDNSNPYVITNDVTFVYRNGSYTYVQDSSAGLLIYGTHITTSYVEGDQISNLTGTRSVYYNQIEMTASFNTNPATSNTGAVAPIVVTMADLLANYDQYDAKLIMLQGVTLTDAFSGTTNSTTAISQGSSTCDIYNRFGVDTTLAAGTVTDVTGFAAIHNSSIQIYPRTNADLAASTPPVPQPALTIISPADGADYSTLDTLGVTLNIENFTIGTDGLLKIESNLLTAINMPNPSYLNAMTWMLFQNMAFSPLPAGSFSATFSLVGLDSLPLTPAVSATTDFTVTAPVLPTPTITVTGDVAGPDTYYFTANVTLAVAEPGAEIRYTTDGTTPTATSTLYTAPFNVTTTSTVKAIALKANYANSAVAEQSITIAIPVVATPTLTPGTGIYADSVVVTMACATADAQIRYTTDGTEPTAAATLYAAPITLTANTTLKAKAFKTNWNTSETVTATYTIAHEPALAVTPGALNFNSTTLTGVIDVTSAFLTSPVAVTCNNTHFTLSTASIPATSTSAQVTVTFDGTEPATGIVTFSSDTLTAQVSLTATATLPTPVIAPSTGTTDTMVVVTMSCANSNANIHYTTDGTAPTASAALYTAPVVLNTPGFHTVKAIAILNGWDNSDVATATYTITVPEPPAPVYNDTVIYYTSFDSTQQFVGGNNFQNDQVHFTGPAGQQWGTYHGTPSTTSAISGDQSMQMRYYVSGDHFAHIGYTFTNFDLNDVTRVTFSAKSTNGLNMTVSYSTDGGNTYQGTELINLTQNAQNYTYVVSDTGAYAFVRLRFAVAAPIVTPNSTSRVIIDSVVVYGVPGIVHNNVATPEITPASGFVYAASQTVTITCATAGASIYYTTDGSIPTQNSTLYTAPFTIDSNVTIKAKAFKDGDMPSLVATATYEFPVTVANISAFKAANTATNSTVYKIAGDVTFVFKSGSNIYVQDNTAGLLVYDNQGVITGSYAEGDVISGGIFGTYTLYNGLVEMVPTHDWAASTQNTGTVSPVTASVEDIAAFYYQYESKLVTLAGVTFTAGGQFTTASATNLEIEQNGETMQVRNTHKTLDMTIPAGSVADVTGFVLQYNGTYQIAPRDNDDIVLQGTEAVADPVIDIQPLTNNMSAITITCATDGATIHYTFDGTDPDENSPVYTDVLSQEGIFTIKAIAMKDGMSNSNVVSATNSGICDRELAGTISVYPNPATDKVTLSSERYTMDKVVLYDIFGQQVRVFNVNDQTQDIDLSQLRPGTYFLYISTANGIAVQKVVKK
ncbi:MAG: chitobiase/beta-hexosaminidase C-terminal domain-containing protein [Bacteroidales bacterium]|nr:chitobiase/beta-hexosaminidase C-terminal domain-containing protein [Bacteroidales bacterium]